MGSTDAVSGVVTLSWPGIVLVLIVGLIVGAGVVWAMLDRRVRQFESSICGTRQQLELAEQNVHRGQSKHLEAINQLVIQHSSDLAAAKGIAFEQGRQLGIVEGKREHLEEVLALKADLSEKMASEVDHAVSDARKRLTAEFELQSKLFTVQVSPFVNITEDKGLIRSETVAETGYQYQLLVNGIPAFQPHQIVERSEVRKEVSEEKVKELTTFAVELARGAIETYMGASGGQFAKLAAPIVKRLAKK